MCELEPVCVQGGSSSWFLLENVYILEKKMFKNKLKKYSQQNNTNRLMPGTSVADVSLDDD